MVVPFKGFELPPPPALPLCGNWKSCSINLKVYFCLPETEFRFSISAHLKLNGVYPSILLARVERALGQDLGLDDVILAPPITHFHQLNSFQQYVVMVNSTMRVQ